jgi:hypothetical protein
MDGRIQESILRHMRERTGADHVDAITEPGPCKILADRAPEDLIDSIKKRLDISLVHHGSTVIAISGHHDCAGNPVAKETQLGQLEKCREYLQGQYPGVEIVTLWVNDSWEVEEI